MGKRIVKVDGKPAYISETRVIVSQVIEIIKDSEYIFTDVFSHYPFLTINDIKMVQEYYKLNKDEIDKEMEERR